ncbi:uncharacterized protein DNG_02271 [Cephalotrichum gorgonifer]|uniref:lytic cellulose monooxygenase (C4-dehydrogenating) n=1 Tax=Cephalotrichum gorgonifer TaxID=2041049 RepID=A0AAE8MUI9_9PEZI|nr:uncharacterized protein DNG_02271 [Cephalotrichum gorgonifer]
MRISIATAIVAQLELIAAHSYIYGIYLNGEDLGSFNGIRIPAFNGPPPRGYANSPVKDVTSPDIRCNVLGDHSVPYTIDVVPGDTLTLDWHHDSRTPTDDVIDKSHHGAALAYLSPDPPTENSFVKIWHKGKYEQAAEPLGQGKWAITSEIKPRNGLMNVRIPADLAPGPYLLRAELIALHEADARFDQNPIRGAQFYPNCVQLMVGGNGTVELPEGVSFPGAYSFEDPGVHHDVYCSTKTTTTAPCPTEYVIPGPTVWSGAWEETTDVEVGPSSGPVKISAWETWIQGGVVTSGSYDGVSVKVSGTSSYVPSWPTTYEAPQPTS